MKILRDRRRQSKLHFANIVANALQQICHPNIQSVSIPCESQWLRIGKEGKRKVFGPSTRARKVKVSAPLHPQFEFLVNT